MYNFEVTYWYEFLEVHGDCDYIGDGFKSRRDMVEWIDEVIKSVSTNRGVTAQDVEENARSNLTGSYFIDTHPFEPSRYVVYEVCVSAGIPIADKTISTKATSFEDTYKILKALKKHLQSGDIERLIISKSRYQLVQTPKDKDKGLLKVVEVSTNTDSDEVIISDPILIIDETYLADLKPSLEKLYLNYDNVVSDIDEIRK